MALFAGCSGPDERSGVGAVGLVGDGLANPFPSAHLMVDGHVAIPAESLPELPTAVPVERASWRTGFSTVQTSVLRMDGIDPEGLPGLGASTPGEGSVRLADLTAGSWLPVLAELDAHPLAHQPSLLIRPLVAVPVGHRVAVVVTDQALARPDRFEALLTGHEPPELAGWGNHYRGLVAELGALGMPVDAIALAWDFPVGDGTAPLRSALEQLEVDGAFSVDTVRNLDDGNRVAPRTFRAADATFAVTDFLTDDLELDLGSDGSVTPVGQTHSDLYIHIPESVSDAPAGSVPVLVFGHGIFGEAELYLDDRDDPSSVLQLADELGAIVLATKWRGLTYDDLLHVLDVAQDLGRAHELTDRLVQGQVNTRTLVELAAEGPLLSDDVFRGRSGQLLPDPGRILYYGISLGAIEGAVFLAQDPPVDAAVLHVGGAVWSTMLERSSNWPVFELLVEQTVKDPADRQVLYALTQLWWDPVDPIAWVPELMDRELLLQVSIGDEQVPNVTSEVLARSIGLPVLQPEVFVPDGLAGLSSPAPPGSRALVQFDPEIAPPPPTNRPAAVSGAHEAPRLWDGTRMQTIDYLTPGAEAQIVHHCGSDACSASNPGPN